MIQVEQIRIFWESLVYERLTQEPLTKVMRRRRQLLLDMSWKESIAGTDVPRLSTELAASYANLSTRTIKRDLNYLLRMDLVQKSDEGYKANIQLLFGAMPIRL